MIKDLIRRHKQKKQEIHNSITRHLQNHVEARGVVPVDNDLADAVGAGRKILFRAAYELAIRERLAIVADTEGQILLMTNSRYRDRLFTRSGLTRPETPLEQAEPQFAVAEAASEESFDTLVQDDVLAVTEDTVPIDTVGVEMIEALADDDALSSAATETLVRRASGEASGSGTGNAAAGADAETDLDWFAIEVKDALSWQEVLADYRQSLPERNREPWPAKKDAGVDLGFFVEK
ncbi:MAG: hypothetical protein LIQ31_02040 [Planctomycetes bacterium]|nr:hypothetical protein [Planctomycetota bacterium]